MKRLKSALEIALERADKIGNELTPEEERLERRERIRPILAKFYRGKISAEGLWETFKDEEDDLRREGQRLLVESLGLRSLPEQCNNVKEGVLAIETLKKEQNSNLIEQYFNNIEELLKKYNEEQKSLKEEIEKEVEENSQMRMRPVRNPDGKMVMKLESVLAEEVEERVAKETARLEEMAKNSFSTILAELKEII